MFCSPVFHVPKNGRTAESCGHAEVRVRFWKGGQEAIAAAAILPGDQLTEVPAGPIATSKQ